MAKKNFVLLLSMGEENAALGKGMLAKLQRDVDQTARPAWIDARGAGIFVQTDITATALWNIAFPDHLTAHERRGVRDLAVLQLGPDCLAWPESKLGAWLNSHRTVP